MVKKIITIAIIMISLFLTLCSKTDIVYSGEDTNFSAGVRWLRDSVAIHPDIVDSIRFTLTSPYFEETKIKTYAFTDSGGSFKGIPASITISILVEGLDISGAVIYSGLIEDIKLDAKDVKVMVEANLVSPTSPDSLFADVKSSKTIQLSWLDRSSCEDGFIIYRSIKGGLFDSLKAVDADIISYNDTNLTASTMYSYRVYAVNSAGKSINYSQSDIITTLGIGSNSNPYFIASVKSALVYDTIQVGDTYKKAITAVDDDGMGDSLTYTAYSKLTLNGDTISWTVSISDTGLQNIWVKVSDTSATSDSLGWSIFIEDTNSIDISLPVCPDSIIAEVKSSETIQLSWIDRASNEDGFIIYRSVEGGTYDSLTSVGANIIICNDTGLVANTLYGYRIYAFNSNGKSLQYSQSESVTTQSISINSEPYFIASVKNSLIYDTIAVGDIYKKAITAIDDDGENDTLKYSAHTNLTVVDDTITWIIEIGDTGLQNLWVKVSDTSGSKDSLSWSIFIEDTAAVEYEKPVASQVSIAKLGDSLHASYTYSHSDSIIIEGTSIYKWFLNNVLHETGKLVISLPNNLTISDTIKFEVTPIAANDSVPFGDPVAAVFSGFISDDAINDFLLESNTYNANYRYSFADTLGARGGNNSGGILDNWGSETQLQIAIPDASFNVNMVSVNFSNVDANYYWMGLAAAQEILGYDMQLIAAMAAKESFAGTKPQAYVNGGGGTYGPFQLEGPTGLDRALCYPELYPYYESQLSSAIDAVSSGINASSFLDHYTGTGALDVPTIISSIVMHAQVLSVNYRICEHATKIYWLEALNASVDYRLGATVILAMYNLGAWGQMAIIESNLSVDKWSSTAANPNSSDLFPVGNNGYRTQIYEIVSELESASKQSLIDQSVEIMDFSITQNDLKSLFFGDGGSSSLQGSGGLLQHWHLTGSSVARKDIEDKLDLLFSSLKGKSPSTIGTDAVSFRYDLLFIMRSVKSYLIFNPPKPTKGDAGTLIQNYSN